LIVSGWQDVNIGDIAHTPGLLHIIETFIPEAEIILWKKSKSEIVEELLGRSFPKVKIIHGDVDEQFNVNSEEVKRAIQTADIMIHGSGPSVVGETNLRVWTKFSKKPFGLFGVTIQEPTDDLSELLKQAAFIFTRETKSIEVLEFHGISGSHISFVPDATFFLDLEDDAKAGEFQRQYELKNSQYICVIPRLRYTPYHKIRKINWTPEKIAEVESVNEAHKEEDHAKLREAIIWWVRNNPGINKVVVCPEMTYEVDIMDELLIDPLPEDVKSSVVKHGYWLPDEAASLYKNAYAILSFECHSPIIALANGTPAFYLRQPQDTIKGQMYYDLGYDDWVFEIEETDGAKIVDALSKLVENTDVANKLIISVNEKIRNIYQTACDQIKTIIS